jgi:hypothetical protein
MIPASELRIGNLVNYEQTNHRITAIDNGICRSRWIKQYDKEEYYEHGFADIKPIIVTSEILEKFGFQWEDIQTHANKTTRGLWKDVIMMLPSNSGHWYACPFGYPMNINRTLYVHQLQNLFYAITGEELIISFDNN